MDGKTDVEIVIKVSQYLILGSFNKFFILKLMFKGKKHVILWVGIK